MSDVRTEIERLKSDMRIVEGKVYRTTARLNGIPDINVYQHLLVVADEDIEPDKEGKCYVMWRLGKQGQDNGERELKKREQLSVKVYNHRKTPIWKDDEFSVAVDAWGDYYPISPRDNEAAFFLTGEAGIPAASGQFNPQSAECERHYFNQPAGVIDPVVNPDDGSPVFEWVYNHTTNAVAADKLIQAKRIDGAWFIDVEPC